MTTGATTDGGVPHGDQSSKKWRKERETERKTSKIIINNAKNVQMTFRIVGVVGSNPIRSTKKRTTAVILPWFFFIFLHQKYPLAYSSKQAFQIACLGDIKFLKILFDNIFHNSTKCDTINCNINWMIFPVSGIEKVMIV